MEQVERTVIGVDLAAGRGVTALAALRLTMLDGRRAPVALSLLGIVHPPDDDAIVAEAAHTQPAVIGLDAPLSLPAQVAAAVRGASPPLGGAGNASPYTRAAERDPIWSRLGVRPFPVSFLGGLTFRAIPLATRLRARMPASQVIEVFPSAALVALELRAGARRGQPRQAKTSLDGRRATQNALAVYVSGMAPATGQRPPLDADSLDAIAAALTAAAAVVEAVQAIGEPSEGCIILPSRRAAEIFIPQSAPGAAYDV